MNQCKPNIIHRWIVQLTTGVCLVASAQVYAQTNPASVSASSDAAQPQAARPQGGGIQIESSYPDIISEVWQGARLPDGQPDIQGHWSNTIANHNNFTDPQGGIPNDPNQRPNNRPRESRAPSRVTDPADGQLPLQPWALAKVKEFQIGFHNPVKEEHIEPLARCAPGGIPKSLYWHGYEISQYPGYVLFQFNSGTRIIHLDSKPHLPENIKLWNGDSRGHWEGNTLVVDVANQNGKALFGRSGEFITENAKIKERYIFNQDRTRYNYVAVIDDATVYTRPFTITIPARRYTEKDEPNGWHNELEDATHTGTEVIREHYERVCTENNSGFGISAAK